jgi:hypothetical protein
MERTERLEVIKKRFLSKHENQKDDLMTKKKQLVGNCLR